MLGDCFTEVYGMEKKKTLHPSVRQFKEFVKRHPQILDEVRKGNATLQELFEEWYLLGEDDSRWDKYRNDGRANVAKTNDKDFLASLLQVFKNIDANQLQTYIATLSEALGALQNLISQFQSGPGGSPSGNKRHDKTNGPFQFRKD